MVTLTPRVLQAEEVVEHLRALRKRQPVRYWAFYSSQLGGIVTDPALMVIPFDDHMVHRGHGDLRHRGDRRRKDLRPRGASRSLRPLRRTFEAAPCPARARRCATSSSGPRRRAASATAAIRYWMSSGPGSLELTPAAGAEPGFFVMIFAGLVLSGAVVHAKACA